MKSAMTWLENTKEGPNISSDMSIEISLKWHDILIKNPLKGY